METIVILILIFILYLVYILIPCSINRYIIKRDILRQKKTIQSQVPNTLLAAKSVYDIEIFHVFSMFMASIPFIIAACSLIPKNFIIGAIHLFPIHIEEHIVNLLGFLVYYMIALLLFCLLDLLVMHIRKTKGFVQGAIFFDPKEKKIYSFPSITSNYYKEYQESELIYTKESFCKGVGYVFFTNKENEYAFKVGDLKYNIFQAILSQKEPIDMPIPFKYRFHTNISIFLSLAIFILGLLIFIPLMR